MTALHAQAAAPTAAATNRAAIFGGFSFVVFLAILGSRNGAYFPTAWGWAMLVLGWVALLLVVVAPDVVVTRSAAIFAGAFSALTLWTWISTTWSDSSAASALEGERALLYLVATVVTVLVARTVGATGILASLTVAAALLSADGLASRMFPGRIGTFDPVSGYRLASPVGYWNAMGLVAALGAVFAIGFLAHAHTLQARAAAAASLVVFAPTIYLTFSRGAWLALVVGVLMLVGLDPGRLEVCVALAIGTVVPAAVVALASHSSAFSTLGADIGTATAQGHRLLVAVLVGAVVAALLGGLLEVAHRRYIPGETARRAFVLAVLAVLAIGAATVVVRFGSPWHLAARGWHSFTAPPSQIVSGQHLANGANLNSRLFQLSNNNRIVGWKSALHEWRSAPVVGRGAGSFEDWWMAHRSSAQQIRDAHSLYLESLGELGIVGLALVAIVILLPLAAAWRYRRSPYVAVAAAAFVAWAVHAGLDWDWEVPAATLPALACAVLCCSAGGSVERLGRSARIVAGAVGAAVALFGIVAGIGNQALASSRSALDNGNYADAQIQARRAARWAPWLSEPWIIQGQIDALDQNRAAARAHLRKAIAKDPRNYLAWYSLAGVTSGPTHEAAVAKVVQLNPLSDEAKELSKGS